MGALAPVDLPAYDALRVLYGDLALPPLNIDDNTNDGYHHDNDKEHEYQMQLASPDQGYGTDNGVGELRHDPGKDDQGNAVANAPLCYLFS